MLLEARQLTLKIAEKILCDQLNVTFTAGESWAILGCNGSGKTTLLHTLAGLLKPVLGAVYLNEKPLLNLSRKEIAKKIAILLQNYPDPFPNSVADTVLMGRQPYMHAWLPESAADKKIVQEALKTMDLLGTEAKMLQQLSGGERRRVAIASVIAQTATIYLLDEPINQLDPKHQLQVLNYFQALKNKQKLIISVLHDVNVAARFCTHALMLFSDGKYLAGPVPELFQVDILTRLYQQEIKLLTTNTENFWLFC